MALSEGELVLARLSEGLTHQIIRDEMMTAEKYRVWIPYHHDRVYDATKWMVGVERPSLFTLKNILYNLL